MRGRAFFALPLLTAWGCGSPGAPRPVETLWNSLHQTHCVARVLKPGTRHVDFDRGRGSVEVSDGGTVHPRSTSPGENLEQ